MASSAARSPILGVCLGHQVHRPGLRGAIVDRAHELMHGKTSAIFHTGVGVFADLPNPFEATRYHSLVVDRAGVPDVLEVTAETADGVVMGLRHRDLADRRACSSTPSRSSPRRARASWRTSCAPRSPPNAGRRRPRLVAGVPRAVHRQVHGRTGRRRVPADRALDCDRVGRRRASPVRRHRSWRR